MAVNILFVISYPAQLEHEPSTDELLHEELLAGIELYRAREAGPQSAAAAAF